MRHAFALLTLAACSPTPALVTDAGSVTDSPSADVTLDAALDASTPRDVVRVEGGACIPACSSGQSCVDGVCEGDAAVGDASADADLELIRRGRNAAALCAFCHQDLQGRFAGQTTPRPMSMQYGTNLTPDSETGIGQWTDEEIRRAVRTGVARDGRTLCNLMTRYSDGMLTDDTLNAIIAFLRSVEPVRQQVPRSACP